MPKTFETPEERREWERVRKAKQREKKRADQQLAPSTTKTKKPSKTFASYLKVREIRRGEKLGTFYVDMTVGPYDFPGQHYVAQTGQLHWTSCRTQRLRPKLNKQYYVSIIRPMVISAIEVFLTAEKGKPTTLPTEFLFPPTPRKQGLTRTRKSNKTKESAT